MILPASPMNNPFFFIYIHGLFPISSPYPGVFMLAAMQNPRTQEFVRKQVDNLATNFYRDK